MKKQDLIKLIEESVKATLNERQINEAKDEWDYVQDALVNIHKVIDNLDDIQSAMDKKYGRDISKRMKGYNVLIDLTNALLKIRDKLSKTDFEA